MGINLKCVCANRKKYFEVFDTHSMDPKFLKVCPRKRLLK